MTWNIADAKQQFSEVVRLSAEEPQAIYNRNTPVAALISATEFERFMAWKASRSEPDLSAQFAELRQALGDVDPATLFETSRHQTERPNSFLQMIEQETMKAAPQRKKAKSGKD